MSYSTSCYTIAIILTIAFFWFWLWVPRQAAKKNWGIRHAVLCFSIVIVLAFAMMYFFIAPARREEEAAYQKQLPSMIQSCRDYLDKKNVSRDDAWWLDGHYVLWQDAAKSLGLSERELAKLLVNREFTIRRK
ncbi:MAG: hypothetical protein NTV48_02425 [Candidatus Vogelbacteria bacterium]|nr:hypothetical protein [Candidatus Vogelbacteria bacterium]